MVDPAAVVDLHIHDRHVRERAAVGHLATRLRVERGAVEEHRRASVVLRVAGDGGATRSFPELAERLDRSNMARVIAGIGGQIDFAPSCNAVERRTARRPRGVAFGS